MFLDAVEAPGAYLTPRQGLDRKTLHALDEKMQTFRTDTHPRTDQKYYLLLNLFQRICMAGRLHVPGKVRGKLRMIPTERLAALRKLPPACRFLSMLETLWVDCDWDELSCSRWGRGLSGFQVEEGIEALLKLPRDRSIDVVQPTRGRRKHGFPVPVDQHNLFVLLGFWGFIDVTVAPPDKSRSRFMPKEFLIISALTVTKMGSRFLSVLQDARPFQLWNLPWREHCPARFPGESIEAGDGGVETETPFTEAFVHLFADNAVASSLPRPVAEIREGTYVFHVTLPNVSRTIAMSHRHTLEDLHLTIQDAFDFDYDHLYAFYMDGKRSSRHAYQDPRCDEAPFADEAAVGQLDLYVGQRFMYFFDFGDSWEFGVELREISDAPHRGKPTIVAAKGDPPQQYPDSDW